MDPAARRQLAKDLYGQVWTVLETKGRTTEPAAGNADDAAHYNELAREAGEAIGDAEDREVFYADFATLGS